MRNMDILSRKLEKTRFLFSEADKRGNGYSKQGMLRVSEIYRKRVTKRVL